MKTIFKSTLAVFFLLITLNANAQRAKDGNYTVTAANDIVNTYTFLTLDAFAGATSIAVSNNAMTGGFFGGALAPGDLILIIQMQGADIAVSTGTVDNGFGNYTVPPLPYNYWSQSDWANYIDVWGAIKNYNNAGKFERIEVQSVSGANTITLQCGLKNNYAQAGKVQVIRIPRFNNLTVNNASSIVSPVWNGQVGGIVALEVDNILDLQAGSIISTSGLGFRAGQLDPLGSSGGGGPNEVRYLGTSDGSQGSEKGESIFGYYTELDLIYSRYGISAAANGGGGGGYQNTGGGGGSNIYTGSTTYSGNGVPVGYLSIWNLDFSGLPLAAPTAIGGTVTPGGGRGGYSISDSNQDETVLGPRQSAWGGDLRKTNGGRGGHPLAYDATRIFFGGGGGAGDQDSDQGGAGGAGGGLVFITNYGTIIGSGTIEANGQGGQNSNPNNDPPPGAFTSNIIGNDGAGGGGAGGSIYIENSTAVPGTIILSVQGGAGGNQNLAFGNFAPLEAAGPGGSGAGGSISFANGGAVQQVNAGINGVTNSSQMVNFPPNGATEGHSGVGNLSAPYYDVTAMDVTICANNTADLTAVILGTLPAGGTVEWYTSQFGGASVNSGLTFTTPILAATTTYYVGVCPGTFRIPVVVTVTGAPNLVITDPAAVCAPGSVDITLSAVTVGSDAGTLTYWTDLAATNPLATPTAVGNGTYYIQLDIGGGCADVQPVVVTVNPSPNLVITDPAVVCAPGSVDITLPAVTVGSDVGTLTYWTDLAAITPLVTPNSVGTGTYYIQLDVAGCTDVQPVVVTVNPLPNLVITDPAAICAPGSVDITLPAVTVGSDAGTLTYWTDLAATTPLATPNSVGTGTYYIQLDVAGCTDVQPVVVTVNPLPNLVITDPAAICAPGSVDITLPAVTVGSDAGTLTYWTDLAATTPLATPNSIGTGTYYIQLVDANTCAIVQAVTTIIDPLDDASFTMTATCDGGISNITGTAGGVFTFNVAPIDGAVIDGVTGVVSSGTTGNSYDIRYTTSGTCPANSIVSVTAISTVTYTAVVTDENCGANDGQIVLTGAGGVGGPFQYSITGGAPYSLSGTFSGLSANSYSISVLDNSGCEITGVESVSGTGGPTIDVVTPTDPSCAGVCDASISVSVSGGTLPYTYQWFDNLGNPIGTNASSISGLCAGDYSVQVTDGAGLLALFSDDFETGAPGWNLASIQGVEGADPNFFTVSDNEGGVIPGGCGIAANGDATLHITSIFFPTGGAAYDAGGLCGILFCPLTNRQAETPMISTVGQSGLTLNFDFIAGGDISNDQGTVWYNDGFGWTQLGAPLFSGTGACAPQGIWTAYTSALPVSCENIPNLQIAIRWENNDDGVGTDPSLAVNNLQVVTVGAACPAIANMTLTDPLGPNLVITDPAAICAPGSVDITLPAVTVGSDAGTLTYWTDLAATTSLATPTAVGNGTYYIQLDVAGCTDVQPVIATVTSAPNLVITDPAASCAPGSVDITLPTITVGSDAGTLTYWTDLAATTPLATPNSVGTGTYYIQLDVAGCTDVQSVTVIVNPLPNLVITDPSAVCAPGSVDITLSAVTVGSDAGTLTYWSDILATTPIVTPTSVGAGTYYIQLENANACSIIQAVNVVVNPLPNLVITDPAGVCAPGTIDITLPAVTAGSDVGTLTYWSDIIATIPLASPNAISTFGTYYIQLDVAGCTSIQPVGVSINNGLVSAFTASPTSGCGTPFTATFTDNSSIPDTWSWNFGDATTSTVQNPTHNYTSYGTFTITLTIVDTITGCSDVSTESILVSLPPVIDPISNVIACDSVALPVISGTNLSPAVGYFTGINGAGTTYLPGDFISSNMTLYAYDIIGICSSEVSFTVTVNPSPNLVITNPAAVCVPGVIDITTAGVTVGSDAGTLTYWTDAAVSSPLLVPTAVGVGTYYIQLEDVNTCTAVQAVVTSANPLPILTITNPVAVCVPSTIDVTLASITAGSDAGTLTYWTDAIATTPLTTPNSVGNGTYYIQLEDVNTCTVVQAVTVTVNALPNLIITDPTGVCTPGTVNLTTVGVTAGSDAGTVTYWTDLAATIPLGTPNSVGNGTYYIQLEDVNTCAVIQAVTATVNPLPNLMITNPMAVCTPGTVDITLPAVTVGSDVGTLTYWTDLAATTPLGTPNSVGSGIYYIQLEDANTCTVVQSVTTTITASPNLVITDPAAECDPNTVDLTVAGITTGSDVGTLTYWTDAAATVVLGSPNAVGVTNTYYVQLEIGGGCTTVQPVNVLINTLPNIIVSDPAVVCAPATIDLTVSAVTAGSDTGTFSYWTDVATTSPLAYPATVVTTGTYFIELTDANGCSISAAVNTVVNPIEDATFSMSPTCDGGIATVTGDAGGTFSFNPMPTDGAFINSITGEITDAVKGTVYTIQYVTSGPCSSSSIEIVSSVDCADPISVVVPTAFTPNGDGVNDTWEIQDLDNNYPNNIVKVFNRWGNLIFEHSSSATNPYNNNQWDGSYTGDPLPVGSYYFIIDFNDGTSDSANGTVSILLD